MAKDDKQVEALDDDTLFSQEQLDRYARTMALQEIGYEGQVKLQKGSVLVVGAGGLGSPCLFYLAGAGVGTIAICDIDEVDISNLQRQVLHTTEGATKKAHKVDSAIETLKRLNPEVKYVPVKQAMDAALADDLVPKYDIIVDGLDNHETRYILSDACVKHKKALVSAGVDRFSGYVRVLCTPKSPCIRCIQPELPPPGEDPKCVGLFGTVTGVLGLMQATEVLKYFVRIGKPLVGRTLLYNGLEAKWQEVPIQRNPDCKTCGG
jgi:adenylyltransferase/sulfurtransferase